MRMIDVRCSGLISSNTPSVIQYANRKCLPDMRVLSIVLIVMLISYAKINNNYCNSLAFNELNWPKNKKKKGVRLNILLQLQSFSLLNSRFNTVEYQAFRKVIHPNHPLHLLDYF